MTATNVTACSPEYFHPKITPDMPVALAVKCSICLPGEWCGIFVIGDCICCVTMVSLITVN